jgi:hypothetical protein
MSFTGDTITANISATASRKHVVHVTWSVHINGRPKSSGHFEAPDYGSADSVWYACEVGKWTVDATGVERGVSKVARARHEVETCPDPEEQKNRDRKKKRKKKLIFNSIPTLLPQPVPSWLSLSRR